MDVVYNCIMDDIKKLLGLRIRELRQKRNLSQEQLAELVNLDRRSISNIECGNTFPSSSLSNIAKALGTNLKNLFDYECNNLSETQIITDINEKLNRMDKDKLHFLYRLIDIL